MKTLHHLHLHLLPLLFFFLVPLSLHAQVLSPSQIKTLLRIQRILEYPPSLSPLTTNATTTTTTNTNFCFLPPSPSLSISCIGTRVTHLSISGPHSLSPSFSIDSLFTTLSKLPSLTSLSLVSLGLFGPLPSKIHRLSQLQSLNLSSNRLSHALPTELSSMSTLTNLVLTKNSFTGTLPSLKSLTELDLRNNSFTGGIPSGYASLGLLQRLDLSLNQLGGKVPAFLFSLGSVQYLDLSGNKFTGTLDPKLTCGGKLRYVDVSSNLLVGGLPSCIGTNSSTRVVLNSWNCMSSKDSRFQHKVSFCSRDPLAAAIPLPSAKNGGGGSASKLGLILGGILGGVAILGLLVFLVFMKAKSENATKSMKLRKPVVLKAAVQVAPRTPTATRHMSQAVRIGTLGLTPYRVFTMEELDEATNGFDPINFISEGPQGKFYRGWLRDGSTAVIRCFKLKQTLSPQILSQYMDVISRLRHVNLVSFLGHYIPTDDQESSITDNNIFLVFEYVSNGTLRSHLTEWRKREMLKWPQRVAAVIGVARGIQFLHTVTVPGIVGNDLSIENILLDETLTAKISNYNLPMLSKNKNNKVGSGSPFSTADDNDDGSIHSLEHGEKKDVYQLGLILLEIITGKPVGSPRELDALKVELQDSLSESAPKLRTISDPTMRGTFALDSLHTLVTVALNCVATDHRERPSIDDILWNLQYSVQVQDGWTSSDSLSVHSYNS